MKERGDRPPIELVDDSDDHKEKRQPACHLLAQELPALVHSLRVVTKLPLYSTLGLVQSKTVAMTMLLKIETRFFSSPIASVVLIVQVLELVAAASVETVRQRKSLIKLLVKIG